MHSGKQREDTKTYKQHDLLKGKLFQEGLVFLDSHWTSPGLLDSHWTGMQGFTPKARPFWQKVRIQTYADLPNGCPGVQDLSSGCPGRHILTEWVLLVFCFKGERVRCCPLKRNRYMFFL